MSNDIPDKPEGGGQMHPNPTHHGTPQDQVGKRMLAAIMFTDVVNFTGRMSQDEEVTLQLVQRDMAWITQKVERHDGRVLKSTGDGLLTCFSSAHECVNCALAVQDGLDDIARHNPSHRALQHRIAVHVGDVFFMHNDIMGDGVNVTARLLQEAAPNAIILSQTVFELVKSGLSVPLSYLGAKQLKHLPLPMAVYQISPRSMKKSQMLSLVPPRAKVGDRATPVVRAAGPASGRIMGPAPHQQPYQSPNQQLPEIQPNPRLYGVKLADTQRDEDAEQQRAGAAMGVHMRTDADSPPPLPEAAHGHSHGEEGAGVREDADGHQIPPAHVHDSHAYPHANAHGIGIPNPHAPHHPQQQHHLHDVGDSGLGTGSGARGQYGQHPGHAGAGDHHHHDQDRTLHYGGAAQDAGGWQQVRITSAIQQPPQDPNQQRHADFQQLHFGRLASQAPYRFLFDMISQLLEERGRLLEGRMEEGWIRAMWPHDGDRRVQARGEAEQSPAPQDAEEARRHPVTGLLKALPKILKGWSARAGMSGGGAAGDSLVPGSGESYVEIRFFGSGFSTLLDIVPDGKHVPEVAPAMILGRRGASSSEARADFRRRSVINQVSKALMGEAHPIPPEYFIPEANPPRPPAYTLRKG